MNLKDSTRFKKLKKILDKLYAQYNFRERFIHDPIIYVKKYDTPQDQEIAALIASSFAYGNVKIFNSVLGRVFEAMENSPSEFIKMFHPEKDRKRFGFFKYRFNTASDLICLLYFIQFIIERYGMVKNLFLQYYSEDYEDIELPLEKFINYLFSINSSPVFRNGILPASFRFLFPRPSSGSSCKRLNLFLRWMVRRGDCIDFGIWEEVSPSRLIIPLDTHTARVSRLIGLTSLKSPGWSMAKDITTNLRKLDPSDPVKYDFVICHLGISGECPRKFNEEKCRLCRIREICLL